MVAGDRRRWLSRLQRCRPQANTLQYSDDGVHFRKIVDTVPPTAPGPYREDGFMGGTGSGITWGVSIELHPRWPYLVRFDCDLRATAGAEQNKD